MLPYGAGDFYGYGRVLYPFSSVSGGTPSVAPTLDAQGNLLGAAATSGPSHGGTYKMRMR